jgi:hypothetical protein
MMFHKRPSCVTQIADFDRKQIGPVITIGFNALEMWVN